MLKACSRLCVVLCLLVTVLTDVQAEPLRGTIDAPEFPKKLDWLNTGGEVLTLEGLRGKVVLLDFWTYGCINCIHIIPDLKKLEAKYANELVVIGVHSAKFEQEGRTQNIRKLVLRYDLEHPVVNDKDFKIWRNYAVRAWPTLVLIDPAGKVVGALSGEGHYDILDEAIGRLVETFKGAGLNQQPMHFPLEKTGLAATPVAFPGKILADPQGQRLFISDSNHHRILITTLDGQVNTIIGGKDAGLVDGTYTQARFHQPQGLTLADENTLYVADTENHVIRKVDLAKQQVSTVAGVGKQVYQRKAQGPAQTTGINSPWDVLYHQGVVYIAMAGQHQIWSYHPDEQVLREFAGSRREELRDGLLLKAGLNQPSGLAANQDYLFIADSEASAIRKADLAPEKGRLDTIVGVGLFEFGDQDGRGNEVRLQHPLAVAVWNSEKGEQLVVADTYNSKIKLVNPATRRAKTLRLPSGSLDEPGGISLLGEDLYIADTNHHRIMRLNLNTRELHEVELSFPAQQGEAQTSP